MCDFLVEIAISETYFKFWSLKFRLTSKLAATESECPQIMLKSEKNIFFFFFKSPCSVVSQYAYFTLQTEMRYRLFQALHGWLNVHEVQSLNMLNKSGQFVCSPYVLLWPAPAS
jgi:hypothetical protein